jgi:hypothetical protein
LKRIKTLESETNIKEIIERLNTTGKYVDSKFDKAVNMVDVLKLECDAKFPTRKEFAKIQDKCRYFVEDSEFNDLKEDLNNKI